MTELNWESDPPAAHGVPGRLQARWISRALHRLWVAGVGLADWQFLLDPYPDLSLATPTGGTVTVSRPAGLYSPGPGGELTGSRPKPFLRGFTLPFDPLRVDRTQVRVWALLTHAGQPVLLQRQARGGVWRTIAHLHAGPNAVLNALIPLRGAMSLRVSAAGAGLRLRSAPRRGCPEAAARCERLLGDGQPHRRVVVYFSRRDRPGASVMMSLSSSSAYAEWNVPAALTLTGMLKL